MNRRLLLVLILGLLHLGIVGHRVIDSELILRRGTVFRFKTAPVDPYDLFRGRYVALDFQLFGLPQKNVQQVFADFPKDRYQRRRVWIAVQEGADDGFARITRWSDKPMPGEHAFAVQAWRDYNGEVDLEFPFKRFYMEESIAPEAEAAYRRANVRGQTARCWAVVRIRNGTALIEDLVIDGEPMREYVRKAMAQQQP